MRPRHALILAAACIALAAPALAQAPMSQLHDALHLNAVQEQAWRVYTRAIAPSADEAARNRQAAMLLPTLDTPHRLALIRAQMQAELVAFDRRAQAMQTFYEALDVDQQRAFDRQTAASAAPAAGDARGLAPR